MGRFAPRCIAFKILTVTLLAFATSHALALDSLSGVYQGQVDGVEANLSLNEIGFSLIGRLQLANGYVIKLNGQRQGETAAGAAASAAGAANFELARNEGGVSLILEETAPLTGRTIRVRHEFREFSGSAGDVDLAEGSRDLRLVGVWLGSEIRYAGDMVLRVAVSLQLLEDGRYLQADDAASQSMAASAQSGQWRIDRGILQLKRDERSDWSALGFYQLRGDDLQLINAEGQAQLWHRQ